MSKAFVIVENPTVQWPVVVKIPNGGTFDETRFTGVFKVLSEEEFEAWGAAPDVPAEELSNRKLSQVLADNAEKFAQVLIGWGPEVMDSAGNSVPFTPELLKAQVRGKHGLALSSGLNAALHQIRFGIDADTPGALLGNSAPPPAAG